MFGVGCIPWSPLARGLLTRPLGEQTVRGKTDALVVYHLRMIICNNNLPGPSNYTYSMSLTKSSSNGEIGHSSIWQTLKYNSLEELATKKGATMAQIALAWSLAQDLVTAPIVGTTSLKNLQDLLGTHVAIK